MSGVPKGQQQDGKLKLFVLTKKLAAYTIQITKNEKVFNPVYNNSLTSKIVAYAIEIHTSCWRANNIYVRGQDAKLLYQERRKLQ